MYAGTFTGEMGGAEIYNPPYIHRAAVSAIQLTTS